MFSIKNLSCLIFIFTLVACASMGSGTKAEKQQEILKMKDAVLTQLFTKKPDINLIFMAAGTGYGVVKNMSSSKYTYMNMVEGGIGLGLGVKDYRIVMIFHTVDAMNNFVNTGWTFGGNADASAKASGKGASAEGEAYYGDVTVYTFTENGLALQATIKGTKFWKDKELN